MEFRIMQTQTNKNNILKLKYKKIDITVKPFFIAEIGFNFANDMKLAKEMIAAAVESNADAVKFQSFRADKIVIKSAAAYNILKENELSFDNHFLLKEYCDKLKIEFFSTAFDIETLEFLIKKVKVRLLKIASGDIDFLPLLEIAKSSNLPILLSTGAADFNTIKRTYKFLKTEKNNVIVLHCVSNYPLSAKNANLLVIPKLQKLLNCNIGFSDHSLENHISCAAAALGARVFEKHFTISRKLGTIDNPMSTEPAEFKLLVRQVNDIITALGTGNKTSKDLAPELDIKKLARRAIYAAKPINKGEIFTKENIKIVRPYFNGSNPWFVKKILGAKSKFNYQPDQPIKNE